MGLDKVVAHNLDQSRRQWNMEAPVGSQELDILRVILREVTKLDSRVSRVVHQWAFRLFDADYTTDLLQQATVKVVRVWAGYWTLLVGVSCS